MLFLSYFVQIILLCVTCVFCDANYIPEFWSSGRVREGPMRFEFRDDYTYYFKGNGWFKLHRMPTNWQTARLICHYEGAELASPLNADMLDTIWYLINNSKPRLKLYFSGVHSTFGNGAYKSIDGTPLEKLHIPKWGVNEPNNYAGTQQCLVYAETDEIWDYDCTTEDLNAQYPYICYRKYSVLDELTECGTIDKGYKLDLSTGNCYKLHKQEVTWEIAHKICLAEGGHLAIINSNNEADLLTNLTGTGLPYITTSIGVRLWGEDGIWWTIHGQTLEQAGFEKWERKPAFRSKDSCGGFRNGMLLDIGCDEPAAFICEKPVDSLTTLPAEKF